MTVTYDVFEDRVKEIDAVVHVDKTARPQIVKEETNPSYYKILEEFNKISGLGCFVNTSFNMHEEPIIATPFDAMRAFDLGSVDCLAIGNFIVWPTN
jgi:carbamoyltransferase